MWPAAVVFVFTYVLVAGRRLQLLPIGRPAGALVGACAMVALSLVHPSGLTPAEAFAAVEPNTIGLLLGMMLVAGAVADAGVFEALARAAAARVRSPAALLWAVTLGAGVLSALLLNDSVCLLAAPLVDGIARRAGLPRVPYLLALAMGSNAGSAMTLAGNPQNMLVAGLSGLGYRTYLWRAGPAGLVALVATAATLHLLFRHKLVAAPPAADGVVELDAREPARDQRWRRGASLVCLVGVSVAFLAGANLAWTALSGAAVVMLARGREPGPLFGRVSWTVLVFFAGLFVVVAGLQKAGVPQAILDAVRPHLPAAPTPGLLALAGLLLVGCQLISNVPFILLVEPLVHGLPDPSRAWCVVAVVSTLAGNLTLLGSVANIIVVETAHAEDEIGFGAYLRVGAPVTLVSTAAALAWLLLVP
ncbi:MAG: arsenic transporter [Myxococcales bacterium]|nr:arsenic transporter [Myxococcales bacterium]